MLIYGKSLLVKVFLTCRLRWILIAVFMEILTKPVRKCIVDARGILAKLSTEKSRTTTT